MSQFAKAVPFNAFQFVMPNDKSNFPDDGNFWQLEETMEEVSAKNFSGIRVNGIFVVDTKNPYRFERLVGNFNTRYGLIFSFHTSDERFLSVELDEGDWVVGYASSEDEVIVMTGDEFQELHLK